MTFLKRNHIVLIPVTLALFLAIPVRLLAQANAPLQGSSYVTPYHFRPAANNTRLNRYYGATWGVEDLHVKWAESGELVRFSWRVVNPLKAKTLHDEKLEPALIDPSAQVKLVIPSLEKVGKLRQINTPIEGRSYWMAFSNTGRVVKRGDMVTIQIGNFHAQSLIVE